MAQLLVVKENAWYQAIASIRNYSEGDFEAKIYKYSKGIFKNYIVCKFKYDIIYEKDRSIVRKPDLVLISKDFKRWLFIEVELSNKPLGHTKTQIRCFLYPEFDPALVADFLYRQNPSFFAGKKKRLINLVTNEKPSLLLIFDDYSQKDFDNLAKEFSGLQICILESYRTPGHSMECYRLSGDYPHDLTYATKLEYKDDQHYKVIKPIILKDFPAGQYEFMWHMKKLKGSILKAGKHLYLKIPDNPIRKDLVLQMIVENGKLIIQTLT